MIIGIGQTAILAVNSLILKDDIEHLSRFSTKYHVYYLNNKNLTIVSIICCIIVVLHHFITDGLILLKKPSYLKFYRLSYIFVFICPIAYIIALLHFKAHADFFSLQMLIYVIDFILFLINLSYLRESYEVFEYMNASKRYQSKE